MTEALKSAMVNTALAKIAAATQVASARGEAVMDADMAQKTHSGTRHLFNSRVESYHNACVDLHQACWEWLCLVNEEKPKP
jgi:hypothetical protein